jgi:hypothetical protein
MLKWLRKYNTFILVVGGCLLMVAFLLQGVLSDLSKHGLFGGTVFKIGSKKVGNEEYATTAREYGAISMIMESVAGRQSVEQYGGGENTEHWFLLTSEAEKAGLVGGVKDGEDFMDEIARDLAVQNVRGQSDMVETMRSLIKSRMDSTLDQAAGQAHLTREQIMLAFAKMRGVRRLENAYVSAARYSGRRLAADSRASSDAFTLDYVLVPAEREMAGVPEPTDAEIKANFDKYKDTPKGGGDYGIGYKLPARVKLAWMELNRDIIASAVTVDGVEVEKRFQAIYPNGQVTSAGKTPETERTRIEGEVRNELADKIVKSADQIVRAEIDKPLRKLDREGDYLRLPADWETKRPDFTQIREVVAKRLLEQYKIMIPAPKVVIRSGSWIEEREAGNLEGIGSAFLKRGQITRMFSEIVFGVREIADTSGEPGFQVGVPFAESVDTKGSKYYFTVLDARKESPPDSLDEIKSDIVLNIKRLAGYDKLKAKEASILADARAKGLEAIAKAPDGSTEAPLAIQETIISKSRMSVGITPASQAMDSPEFRERVINSLAGLDPMTDLSKVDAAAKTFSTPVDKNLSLFVYRAKKALPLTIERFRSNQGGLIRQATITELKPTPDTNPFGYEEMKKRMNVTDAEGRQMKSDKKDKALK